MSALDSNFVLGNAQMPDNFPIVYCSDGFCELTGLTRCNLMRKSCSIRFLWGAKTTHAIRDGILDALATQSEFSDTCKFHLGNEVVQCQLDIVPIKNENSSVVFFLVSVKDVSKDGGLGGSELNSINFATASASHRPSIGLIDTTRNWRRRSRAVLYNLPKNIGLGGGSGNAVAMGDGQFIKNALGKSVLPIAT